MGWWSCAAPVWMFSHRLKVSVASPGLAFTSRAKFMLLLLSTFTPEDTCVIQLVQKGFYRAQSFIMSQHLQSNSLQVISWVTSACLGICPGNPRTAQS